MSIDHKSTPFKIKGLAHFFREQEPVAADLGAYGFIFRIIGGAI